MGQTMNRRSLQRDGKEDGILRIVSGTTKSVDSPKCTLRAVLSSETVDRYGDIIRASAFNTPKNFKNYFDLNPILLWAHNRDCSVPTRPIGKIINPDFNGTDMNGQRAFEGDVVFDQSYEFAMEVWRGYEGGFLQAFSVGVIPITIKNESEDCDGYEFLEVDLLENSAVPIPANPAAVKKAFMDGTVSEAFLERTFFKMRDEVLVRNADIFLPTTWKFRESINALAELAAEIRSGTFKPYEKADKIPVRSEKEKTDYVCESCGKTSKIDEDSFPEKEFSGVKYRDITCEHCSATTEECLAAVEYLSSMTS